MRTEDGLTTQVDDAAFSDGPVLRLLWVENELEWQVFVENDYVFTLAQTEALLKGHLRAVNNT